MAQHDNGRRAAGNQSEPWQRGQQDQAAGGRHRGGQQGGHHEAGYGRHQDQFDQARQQQGDNWRGTNMLHGGSQDGQASDNDYGNRGITESGRFGNYGQRFDTSRGLDGNYDTTAGQGSYGSRGDRDQNGQSGERFGGRYNHGYDARSDSTGASDFGPDGNLESGSYGGRDVNAGGYGTRASRENQRWRGQERDASYGRASDWGGYQSSRGSLGQGNQDRYGDNGYQDNWRGGQDGGQSYHDPDYRLWRSEQMRRLDRDYEDWRQHRYQRFSEGRRTGRDRSPQRGMKFPFAGHDFGAQSAVDRVRTEDCWSRGEGVS